MGRKMIVFWTAVGVLAAVLTVAVPLRSRIREERQREKIVSEIREAMEAMSQETVEKQRKLAQWYNRNVALEEPDPGFKEAYEGILNLGQGRMGLLEIPELRKTLPITHGLTGLAGHDPATALPVGGQGNHTVLYLQENLPLRMGMGIRIQLPGVSLYYQVESIQVMPESWPTENPAPGEMLILVHDRGNQRTIVRCAPDAGRRTAEDDSLGTLKIGMAFAAALTLLTAIERILDGLRKGLSRKSESHAAVIS